MHVTAQAAVAPVLVAAALQRAQTVAYHQLNNACRAGKCRGYGIHVLPLLGAVLCIRLV